jgi:hypothetical protein
MKGRPARIWEWRALAGEGVKPTVQPCGLIPIRRKQSRKVETMVLKWEITNGQVPENTNTGTVLSVCVYQAWGLLCVLPTRRKGVFVKRISWNFRLHIPVTCCSIELWNRQNFYLALVSLWKYTKRKSTFMCLEWGYWMCRYIISFKMSATQSVAVYLTNLKLDALRYYCIRVRRKAVVMLILLGWLQSCVLFVVGILISICGEPINPGKSWDLKEQKYYQ